MYFVQCPFCGDPIEVSGEIIAEEYIDPCSYVACDRCELTFVYEDDEVQSAN